MIDFATLQGLTIPEGNVVMIQAGDVMVWKRGYGYVALGDSIPAGHSIDDAWATTYGEGSQYGVNGNTSTVMVPNCYPDRIGDELVEKHGADEVTSVTFARSGDTVADLIDKLSHDVVREAIVGARLVTVCIGANDVLQPALSHLDEYINTGDLTTLETIVEGNLAKLNTDSHAGSYISLFKKLTAINPHARYVFQTIYNPYKYLWLEEGMNGFFKPVIDSIPQITILGFEIDNLIKNGFLDTSAVQRLFSRVNGLCDWAEKYVTQLNTILRNKISEYGNPRFVVTDAKALFDSFPDRPVSAEKHYNDLVSVEYTRGYNTATMDWGKLHGGDISGYWWGLAEKHTSTSGFDLAGFSNEVVAQTIERVIVPDIDPHPTAYGHYVLMRAFEDTLGWSSLDCHTVTFISNGGIGNAVTKVVVGVDGMPVYTTLDETSIVPVMGYYFRGWNTAPDGSGTTYANGDIVKVTGDLKLYAQWSNKYTVTYKHTNKTNLYGDDETGHMECYALFINGQEMPDLGKFSENNVPVYEVDYGSSIRVKVNHYLGNNITYDASDCHVYWNGTMVKSGHTWTEYSFQLTCDITVEFQWKIAGSLVTFNAQSWEDCYITTH